MNSVNIHTWFEQRELNFCPKHFVKTNTPISTESKLWILERLTGRFYIKSVGAYKISSTSLPANLARTNYYSQSEEVPFFEDPAEATLYELTWS